MQTIRVSVPPRTNGTTLHYIRQGHFPGQLSGAALQGKAALYGLFYSRQRAAAGALVRPYGVVSALALVDSRWCRVWVLASTGARVQLTPIIED